MFGTAATKMASGQESGAVSARTGFWQAKTLTGPPTVQRDGTATTTSYAYTDGSRVTWYVDSGSPNQEAFQFIDPANAWILTGQTRNGRTQAVEYSTYTSNFSRRFNSYSADSNRIVDGVPTSMVTGTYDATSRAVSLEPGAVSQQYLTNFTQTLDDMAYYRALAR